jgi:hypothetical protein
MWLARPFDEDVPPIHRTSTVTGAGLDELRADLLAAIDRSSCRLGEREPYFFDRWVGDEWGRVGTGFLSEQLGGAERYLADCGGYDRAQLDLGRRIRSWLVQESSTG